MIITVGNTKGGVGKTTLAVNLAAYAVTTLGKSVFFIDGDSQDTGLTAITIRNEGSKHAPISAAQYAAQGQLRTQLPLLRDKFDIIVIDVGGRESASLRAALALTDVLIVPFQPRSFDLWAITDIHNLIVEANDMRPSAIQAFAVLNGADPVGSDNAEAQAALDDFPALQYVDTPIRKRKAVAAAAANGLGIHEYKPVDQKAISEFSAFFTKLF